MHIYEIYISWVKKLCDDFPLICYDCRERCERVERYIKKKTERHFPLSNLYIYRDGLPHCTFYIHILSSLFSPLHLFSIQERFMPLLPSLLSFERMIYVLSLRPPLCLLCLPSLSLLSQPREDGIDIKRLIYLYSSEARKSRLSSPGEIFTYASFSEVLLSVWLHAGETYTLSLLSNLERGEPPPPLSLLSGGAGDMREFYICFPSIFISFSLSSSEEERR